MPLRCMIVACSFAKLVISAAPVAASSGPIAQILCAPSADMRERLVTRYRAERAWAGLRNPDEVMELWQNAEGDWTLIITYAGGKRCIVAMGDPLLPFTDMPNS